MDRWLKRPGPAAGPSFDALPEELLQAVIQLVPEVTYQLLGSAVELESRGPVERVCRRWRQIALQLPASLTIDLCEAHDLELGPNADERFAAAMEALLPHLRCRRIVALSISGCTSVLAPEVPVRLAGALYPELSSLHLGGTSLVHFTSFLSMCRRLQELTLSTEEDDSDESVDQKLLCSHLCALRCNLKLLHLTTVAVDKPLAVAIRRHVQPAALMLSCVTPTSDAWLPQLQECSVTFYSNDQISQLNHGLEATVLTQLSSLVLRDARTELLPGASPPNLPALPRLPALCKLECYFNVPRAAWLCRHVTSLLCSSARKSISAPAFGAAQCTNLQQLRFNHCLFGGGAFPASLCSALRQLSSLGIRGGGLTSLPPEFSQLSSLHQLLIAGASIKPPSLETFRRLPGLTALRLHDCQLEGLPHGPYLCSLKSLDLSHNSNRLASAIPFAATAAEGLQALCIDFYPAKFTPIHKHPPDAVLCGDELHEWWHDVEWKLHCFPGLKILAMAVDRKTAAEPEVAALLDDIRSTFPSCRLDLSGSLSAYPQYSGLAEFH